MLADAVIYSFLLGGFLLALSSVAGLYEFWLKHKDK